MADVVLRSDTSKVSNNQAASIAVERDHAGLGELSSSGGDQGIPLGTKRWILRDFIPRHACMEGRIKRPLLLPQGAALTVLERTLLHPHEKVRVTEPLHRIMYVSDSTKSDLSVEGVDNPSNEPRSNP